jgi:hypothetical protein
VRATLGPRWFGVRTLCASYCPHYLRCYPRSRGALQLAAVCCARRWHHRARRCPTASSRRRCRGRYSVVMGWAAHQRRCAWPPTSLPMPAGSAAFVALPPLLSRRQGLFRLASSTALGWGSLLLPVCHHWRTKQQHCYASFLPPRLLCAAAEVWQNHWSIAHPDHPQPESISISQDERDWWYCRSCHDHCCCCLPLAQLFPGYSSI